MNRSEMIDILAEKVGFSRKDIERILNEMNSITVETLAKAVNKSRYTLYADLREVRKG